MYTWIPLLSLPEPPEIFINKAKQLAEDIQTQYANGTLARKFTQSYVSRRLLKDGNETNSRSLAVGSLGIEFEDWVRENISPEFIDAGMRISVGDNTTIHGAHTDGYSAGRPVVKLNYLINTGGENVITSFYQENGQPIERHVEWPEILTVNDYTKLSLLEQVVFPANTWIALNTNILHGVENVVGNRINLTVLVDGSKIKFKI